MDVYCFLISLIPLCIMIYLICVHIVYYYYDYLSRYKVLPKEYRQNNETKLSKSIIIEFKYCSNQDNVNSIGQV